MEIKIEDLSKIHEAAKSFVKLLDSHNVFAFHGEMGAGKTTFINSILEEIGIKEHTSSPTFSIVNEYLSNKFGTIYHFDFYRIEDESEALDIGIEEMIYGNEICFMEWPSKIENLLPENTVIVKINVVDKCRIIDIQL
jgi:tRNA threonylcarbamoyladenosine biosynthesis protein TsaE